MSGTETTSGARDHARAQAGTVVEAMPWRPASTWPEPPAGVDPEALVWAETVPGGGYTSKVLARGTTVRLTDVAAGACAHVLLYNADQPWERLNVADTVKVPWNAYLRAGHPLLSDQGRALATLVSDTSERHDALCGSGAAGRSRFVLAGAKHGLEPRDLPPSLSFFQGVRVEADGALRFDGAVAPAYVELRCELPVVLLVANVAHPLRPDAEPSLLEVLAWRGAPTAPDDPLWTSTPELQRALENSAEYATARGLA